MAKTYQATDHPRPGTTYSDDNKDLLSKGIMAYNRGPNYSGFSDEVWPELMRSNDPPEATTPPGTRTAIKYTLTIQKTAGIPLKSWTWTANFKGGKVVEPFQCVYGEQDWLNGTTWAQKCEQ